MARIILTLILLISFASAQDTVYIANSGNNATVTYKGTVQSIPLSLISASKTTNVLLPTRVAIFNGATQIQDWVFNNYKFKVNSTAITNVDSFVPVVNRLNTASVRSFKLLKDIQVVTALPATIDPTVTYLVGAKDTILISGLDGNNDKIYRIEGVILNPATNDTHVMRFNNISTNVYDTRRSDLGNSYSGTSGSATSRIEYAVSNGSNSMDKISMIIEASTGKNRTVMASTIRSGASNQTIATNYQASGIWRDSSTNLTSITFRYASISGGFGVGTVIRVFSLQP